MGPVANPGIVTGLHAEAALIRKLSPKTGTKPIVVCHGPGPDPARSAAKELIAQGVGGLISFGFAGGIDESIAAGKIVLASQIRDGRRDYTKTTDLWREAVRQTVNWTTDPIEAPIAGVDEIVSEAADKTRLRYETGAIAADMESFSVGEVARDAGLPFIAIRAVSDPALQTLPVLALEAVDEKGRLKIWRVLFSLIRHPGQIGELRRLAKNTRAATSSLTEVCEQIAPHFCLPDFRSQLIRQLRAAGGHHSQLR